LELKLRGQLTANGLAGLLESLEVRIRGEGSDLLLVDCLDMTGYDPAARDLFVSWNARNRGHLRAVAIVTRNTLWHLVVGTMALASRQRMRAFDGRAEGVSWLLGDGARR